MPNKMDKLLKSGIKNEKDMRNTKEERDESIRDIFQMFDKNGDGQLAHDEIGSFLVAIGKKNCEKEIANIIEHADADGNGFIEYDEFINYMDETYTLGGDQIDDLVEAFKIFDVDKSGSISLVEFRNILTKFGESVFTEEDITDIFEMIDTDHSGEVNYAEFIEMWKYQ